MSVCLPVCLCVCVQGFTSPSNLKGFYQVFSTSFLNAAEGILYPAKGLFSMLKD